MLREEVDGPTRRTLSYTTRLLGTLRLDGPLLIGIAAIALYSQLILFSSSGGDWESVLRGSIRLAIGATIMLTLAQLRPATLRLPSHHLAR